MRGVEYDILLLSNGKAYRIECANSYKSAINKTKICLKDFAPKFSFTQKVKKKEEADESIVSYINKNFTYDFLIRKAENGIRYF